jgi:ParB family chromosome partitioning protein
VTEQRTLLAIDVLHPNPNNPRIEAGDVTELSRSIRENGIMQDLLVWPAPEFGEGHYMIEDGYRRWVAARPILSAVPCLVRIPHPGEDPATRTLVTALVTSIHRQELNAIEKARAYGRLRDEAYLTQDQIASMLGISTSSVSRYLALLDLTTASQDRVIKGTLSVEAALTAVKRHRAKDRKGKGHKPIDVGWEPDHFTLKHPMAKRAIALCEAREHTNRRRLGGIACGQCWETAIRQDQMNVDSVAYREAGHDVPFIPPVLNGVDARTS